MKERREGEKGERREERRKEGKKDSWKKIECEFCVFFDVSLSFSLSHIHTLRVAVNR